MHTGLLHTHSFLRWILLILLVISIIKSFIGWKNKKSYSATDNKLSLFTMITAHIQLLAGLILYLISDIVKTGLSDMGGAMKDPALRFWTVEHILGMVIAIALITLGRMGLKKADNDISKHKNIAIYFLIGLFILLISIPWPFSAISRPWF